MMVTMLTMILLTDPIRLPCPVTGDVARYVDTVTGMPYANARAFGILRYGWGTRDHENNSRECYIWDSSAEAFIASVDDPRTLEDLHKLDQNVGVPIERCPIT